ncbi:putative F-box/LRR-repeat protein 23 [Salvia hispanica]|uniref:putative F-box/LRR-repeat protein 23 n=1 Tax=Salvia hispanica TaxID=49212 RepID=UPI002009A845|nr:putative F-box/LRR-repeat protein 23 [Salvia hispanica]
MFSKRRKSNRAEYPIPAPAPAPASSTAPPPPPWIELPEDLTANILQRLDAEEIIMSAMLVCSTWWRVCKNPSMWRVIDLDYRRCQHPDDFDDILSAVDFGIVWRSAMDRSQGQLVELKLTYLESEDGILNYIAERSSQLRCLTLERYFGRDHVAWTDAIKKFTQLEELHYIMMPEFDIKDFETIGTSCPMLKSFTYNESWCEQSEEEDDIDDGVRFSIQYGVAIGKTMPNLRHLRIWALETRNEGLEAILNGCPHLESLDLRRCYGLDLEGDLGKRCCEQIKHLKLPSDCASDLEVRLKSFEDIFWGF